MWNEKRKYIHSRFMSMEWCRKRKIYVIFFLCRSVVTHNSRLEIDEMWWEIVFLSDVSLTVFVKWDTEN